MILEDLIFPLAKWSSVSLTFSSFLPILPPLTPTIPVSSAYLSNLGSGEYGGVALPEDPSLA